MIAADLVRTYGLVMDRYRFKPLKNVNGNSVKVIGSFTFEVVYKGIDVEIVALVSPAIEEEIILSWRTLQNTLTEMSLFLFCHYLSRYRGDRGVNRTKKV